MDRITREVAETRDAVNAAVAGINGLADQIRALAAAQEDPAALNALADQLDQMQADLGAAVNPPAPAPEPAPEPAPAPAPEEPPAEGGGV